MNLINSADLPSIIKTAFFTIPYSWCHILPSYTSIIFSHLPFFIYALLDFLIKAVWPQSYMWFLNSVDFIMNLQKPVHIPYFKIRAATKDAKRQGPGCMLKVQVTIFLQSIPPK